jgi:hypothetical protein
MLNFMLLLYVSTYEHETLFFNIIGHDIDDHGSSRTVSLIFADV